MSEAPEAPKIDPEKCRWMRHTPKQEALHKEWIESRPQVIQDMIAKYNLNIVYLYRRKGTDRNCILTSFNEDGTVGVFIEARFNKHNFLFQALGEMNNRNVFGIPASELELVEWDGEIEDVEDEEED